MNQQYLAAIQTRHQDPDGLQDSLNCKIIEDEYMKMSGNTDILAHAPRKVAQTLIMLYKLDEQYRAYIGSKTAKYSAMPMLERWGYSTVMAGAAGRNGDFLDMFSNGATVDEAIRRTALTNKEDLIAKYEHMYDQLEVLQYINGASIEVIDHNLPQIEDCVDKLCGIADMISKKLHNRNYGVCAGILSAANDIMFTIIRLSETGKINVQNGNIAVLKSKIQKNKDTIIDYINLAMDEIVNGIKNCGIKGSPLSKLSLVTAILAMLSPKK